MSSSYAASKNIIINVRNLSNATAYQNDSHAGERPWWPIQSDKTNENARLRGEGDQIKFIDLRFETGQVVGSRKGKEEEGKTFHLFF